MTNDNTIVPFKPKLVTPEAPAPDEYVVRLLEFWLKKAREGDLAFVAVAALDSRGVAHSAWEPQDIESAEITKGLGAVAYLAHRFNTAAIDADADSGEQPEPPTKV